MKIRHSIWLVMPLVLFVAVTKAISIGDVGTAISHAISGGSSSGGSQQQHTVPNVPPSCTNAAQLAAQTVQGLIDGAKSTILAGQDLSSYTRDALTNSDKAADYLWNVELVRDSGCYDQVKAFFWNSVQARAHEVSDLKNQRDKVLNDETAIFIKGLQKMVSSRRLNDYVRKAATTQEGAWLWLWNSVATRPEVKFYDGIKGRFWNNIKDVAAGIIGSMPSSGGGSSSTGFAPMRGPQQYQYTKYFTNNSAAPITVTLIDISGMQRQVTVEPNGSQGVITINQAGPVVQAIGVRFKDNSEFYIRGAGILGPKDKGDLGKSMYIIDGLNNYRASI